MEEKGQERISNADLVATNSFSLMSGDIIGHLSAVTIDHHFIFYVCIPVFEEMVCYMINFHAFRGKEKL